MPFAGGTKAQQESPRSGREPRLVGVPHHRRIEERSRFQRVLLGEIGADQHSAVFAHLLIGQKVLLDLLETVQEEVTGLLMPVVKLAHHVTEQEIDFRLRHRHQPRQDSLDALGVGQLEGADDDPAVGGLQHDAGPPDLQPGAAISWPVGDAVHHRGFRDFGRARQSIRIHVSLAPDLGVKRSIGSVTRGNRLIHVNLAESRQGALQQFHFAQGQQKCQG